LKLFLDRTLVCCEDPRLWLDNDIQPRLDQRFVFSNGLTNPSLYVVSQDRIPQTRTDRNPKPRPFQSIRPTENMHKTADFLKSGVAHTPIVFRFPKSKLLGELIFQKRSGDETFAALVSAALQNQPARLGAHSHSKTVRLGTLPIIRSKCGLH